MTANPDMPMPSDPDLPMPGEPPLGNPMPGDLPPAPDPESDPDVGDPAGPDIISDKLEAKHGRYLAIDGGSRF